MVQVVVLGSGSSGNAITVQYNKEILLIDAGFSGKELERRLGDASLESEKIVAILISHEHDDHAQGVRVFTKKNPHIICYANSLTTERLKIKRKAPAKISIFSNGVPFQIGAFQIEAFSVCHDAVDPVGFVIHCGKVKIGIITDLGYTGSMIPMKLHDCSIAILESNHDPGLLRSSGRPPHLQHRILGRRGHLSNQHAAELIARIVGTSTRHIILAHLSEDCNRPELAYNTAYKVLTALKRNDIGLTIAKQNQVSETIVC